MLGLNPLGLDPLGLGPSAASGGGSATSLTLADAGHAHTADGLVLTTASSLAVADATHAHVADNIGLSILGTLATSDALHGHVADNLSLTTAVFIVVADSAHSHTADNIVLSLVAQGIITIPAVKDWGTGNLKTGETGVQVDVRSISTGALVVRLSGQTTHATTAVCVVTDALIAQGVEYEVVTRFADGSIGIWDYTAT